MPWSVAWAAVFCTVRLHADVFKLRLHQPFFDWDLSHSAASFWLACGRSDRSKHARIEHPDL